MKRLPLVLPLIVITLFMLFPYRLECQVTFYSPQTTYGGTGTLFEADFNGDGKRDLLSSDGTLQLGNGDGTFTNGTKVSGTPLAVADFNGDGKPDILEQGTGTLLVLLGNGDGTFQSPISASSGANLSPVAAFDLTGSGKTDVVGLFNNALFVYLGKGDGTFSSGVQYNLGTTVVSSPVISFGDFNGDGKIDIVVSALLNTSGNTVPGQEIVFLGNGDGTFQTSKTSAGVGCPQFASVGDFTGDGKLDIAVAANCSSTPETYVLLGNGDGTFQAPASAVPESGPLAAVDVNGDGKLDLIVGSGQALIYLGNGDGTFSNFSNYWIGAGTPGLVVADFNLDGNLDIVTGNMVLLGNGNGTFRGIQLGIVPSAVNGGGNFVTGDFTNSGKQDLAMVGQALISGTLTGQAYILSNSGGGALSLAHTYTLQQTPFSIVTADFNGDGKLDLLVVSSDPTSGDWIYSVLLGNGDGSFQAPNSYLQSVAGSQGYSVVVADFNNDKKPDAAIGMGNQTFAVLLGKGDGTFEAPSYVFDNGGNLVAADLNGDGKVDIVVGDAILLGNGDGTFQAAVFPSNLNGFVAEFTADFNSDGKPDLLGYNSAGFEVALGDGNGTFSLLAPLAPQNFTVNGIADFNVDGKLDLLGFVPQVHSSGAAGIALGNGDGTFGSFINIPIGLSVGITTLTDLAITDMNGDGLPDIVFPGGTTTPVGIAVLLNTTKATPGFSPAPVSAGSSTTSTITVTALNGFSGSVALSCSGLPSAARCSFNPASISTGSGSSTLTVTTASSLQPAIYTTEVSAVSGTISHGESLNVVVQPPPPDFTISAGSGSSSSQTISAGETATFSLALGSIGSFTGTVNLTCVVKPTITAGPTCSLSNSSVQISGSGTQSVTLKVATIAPVTSGAAPYREFPRGLMPAAWISMLIASAWLWRAKRKRLPALATATIVGAFALCVGCGGNGSPTHNTGGTPSGTYAATITATSGSLSHDMALQVIVQ